jgi:hypothetical protein
MVCAVVNGRGDSIELGGREDLHNDVVRKFGFRPYNRRGCAVGGKIGGDVFRVNQQAWRGDVAKEVTQNRQDVET